MGAICKTIAIHGDYLGNLMKYGKDENKTDLTKNGLENLLSYAANPEKTTLILPKDGEKSVLVDGVLCNPETAEMDFRIYRERYRDYNGPEMTRSFDYNDKKQGKIRNVEKSPVTAIHIIQSFKDPDIDPLLVHQIGLDMLERLGLQGVCDTHLNKEHYHNHIIANAYMTDGMHKFCLDKKKIMEIRSLSDDIQREYGLTIEFDTPEEQLKKSHERGSYAEWKAHGEDKSWKDHVREDIINARDVSETKEDFLEIMKEYGYQILSKKDDSFIQYKTPEGKKIWDRTLGPDYTFASLFGAERQALIDRPDEHEQEIRKHGHETIDVSRYAWDGRRRGLLEMMIRKAIAVVQKIVFFMTEDDVPEKTRNAYNGPDKLQKLNQALKVLEKENIDTLDDLKETINSAGIDVNKAKSKVSSLESEKNLADALSIAIGHFESAKYTYDSVKFWETSHDLHLNTYSEDAIREAKAKYAPITDRQKNELIGLMKSHPEVKIRHIEKGFINLSTIDAKNIIDYLDGKTDKMPDLLIHSYEADFDTVYERQTKTLYEKMTYDLPKKMIPEIKDILIKNGHEDIDISSLTLADALNIKNCYGDIPFTKEIPEGHTPAVEDRDTFYERDLEKTKEALALTKTRLLVPIGQLSHKELKEVYAAVIAHGRTPEIFKETNEATHVENRNMFHNDIATETTGKQEVLIALRNAENELRSFGYTPEDIPELKEKIKAIDEVLIDAKEDKEAAQARYKDLIRLKQAVTYSQSPGFLFGHMFNEKDITVQEKDKRDVKPEAKETPDMEPKEEPTPKKKRTKNLDIDL